MTQNDINDNKKPGQKFKLYFLPVCMIIIIVTQLYDYFINGEYSLALISFVFCLFPAAIKNTKYSNLPKPISVVFLIIGIIILVFALKETFF